MELTGKHQNMLSREALYLIFKHKWLLLLIMGFSLLLAGLLNFWEKKEYEASSKILIKPGRERYGNNLIVENETYFSGQLRPEDINSEIEIIKSPDLLRKLVEQKGAEKYLPQPQSDKRERQLQEAVRRLQKKMSIAQIINTDVIEVRYRGSDPQGAADTVNKLLELYLDKHIQVHSSAGLNDFLAQREEEARGVLEQTEQKMKEFYAGVHEKSPGYTSPLSPRTFRSQSSESINYMEKKILELEFEKKQLLSKYKPASQPVLELNKQIVDIRKMLKKERKTYAAKEKRYNVLERQKHIAEIRSTLYKKQLDKALIWKEMDRHKIVSVHVISQAIPPLEPKGMGLIWRLGLALGIAGMFGAVLVIFFYYINDTFYEEAQLEQIFNLPVAASIPLLDHKGAIERESKSQKRIVSTAV